ncbi:hypothetical protein JOD54_005933 [Actinokineospora baliensis]|uniref:DUF397 domain-containing protein n=1 Tax=Actinokineospora baliensis TaxID=547056 RepID=UPI0019576D36|nr:DUF397 domain-containing protein [Actinokineospora baliensis]MBM7775729.1 hypothetical protein [Actinokineospora baliensis]
MPTHWRKSSFSGGGGDIGGGNCVEVASFGATTAIRDSKAPHQPPLRFPTPDMAACLSFIQADNFSRD